MDKYLVSLAILLFLAESVWLSHDINSTSTNSQSHSLGKSLGKIENFKSQVRKRSQDSLIWENTQIEQPLFAYDSVLTMSQSTADISLQGGSGISMNENTLLTIEPPLPGEANGPLRLRFKKGNIRTIAGREPQSLSAGEYIISAGRDSQVNLRSSGEDKIEIEAQSGAIKIIDAKTMFVAEVIQPGESAQIENHQILKEKISGNLQWVYPVDGQKIYTHESQSDVSFSWKTFGNDESMVKSVEASGKMFALNPGTSDFHSQFSLGNYLVKLNTASASTFARALYVWAAPKIHLVFPVARQRFKKEETVNFLWTRSDGVKDYEMQIATDIEFKNIVKESKSSQLGSTVDGLPKGEYFWRVKGFDDSNFEIPELYKSVFYILEKPLEAPKLRPAVIEDDTSLRKDVKPSGKLTKLLSKIWKLILPQAEADETGRTSEIKSYSAEFQWEKVEEAASYVIEISDSPEFRENIRSHHVSREKFKWRNFKLGRYYWRVAAEDARGELGLFSETAFTDLTKIPTKPILPLAIPKTMAKTQSPKLDLVPPVIASVETPVRPEPKIEYTDPWDFSLMFGTHYDISSFSGSDFTAKYSGLAIGDFSLIIAPPVEKFESWKLEFEFHALSLKAKPTSTFPFQDLLNTSTLRFAFVQNEKWGIYVSQYLAFKRTDLEDLATLKFWGVGPMIETLNPGDMKETRYRIAFVGGQVYALDASINETWYLDAWPTTQWSFTVESRAASGLTLNRDFFYDIGGYLWLGFHW